MHISHHLTVYKDVNAARSSLISEVFLHEREKEGERERESERGRERGRESERERERETVVDTSRVAFFDLFHLVSSVTSYFSSSPSNEEKNKKFPPPTFSLQLLSC